MQPGKYHILYVEDHDDTRVLMTILLERAGFRVTPVESGTQCLQLAQSERFDLYLLDHTFPDASGVTVCQLLRDFDPDTPILFYSARALPQEKEAAIKAGAQDYLIKPDDIFHVADHAAKWIQARRRP
ncbi:MAG TPA: response regulator [Pyrinomonadaceae bacterium]|jgi:CheY-like chemotaxis protein|nr:response regulator [Pyrinomonadaceae bacterium]